MHHKGNLDWLAVFELTTFWAHLNFPLGSHYGSDWPVVHTGHSKGVSIVLWRDLHAGLPHVNRKVWLSPKPLLT